MNRLEYARQIDSKYKNLSDDELLKKVHEDEYSDIPFDTFKQKMYQDLSKEKYNQLQTNRTPEEVQSQGKDRREEISRKIQSDLKRRPLAEEEKAQFGELAKEGGAAALGAAKGFGRLGYGADYLLKKGISKLTGKDITPEDPFDYENVSRRTLPGKLRGFLGDVEQQYPASSAVGQFAGMSAFPEIPLSRLPGVNQLISPKPMLDTGVSTAIQSQLANPEQPLGAGQVGAGLLGAAGRGVGTGIGNIEKGIRPEEALKVKKALDALNMELPLGIRSRSPNVSRFEQNILSHIPLSGFRERLGEQKAKLNSHTQDVLNKLLLGTNEEEIPTRLSNNLKDFYKQAQKEKLNLFNETDKTANENGVNVGAEKYKDSISNILNENERLLGAAKLPNELIEKLKDWEKEASDERKKISFKDASLLHAGLNDMMDNYSNKLLGKNHAGARRALVQIKNALYNDMRDAAQSHPEVLKKYQEAQNHYENNVAPFDTPEFKKWVDGSGKGDPDVLAQSFIKTGQYEKPTLLKKLTDKLPIADRSLLAHWYLTKGAGNMEKNSDEFLNEIVKSYKKIGPKTRKILFPGKINEKLGHIETLNKHAPNVFFNPPTGQTVADSMFLHKLMALAAKGITAPVGMLGGGKALTAASFSKKVTPATLRIISRYLPGLARNLSAFVESESTRNRGDY